MSAILSVLAHLRHEQGSYILYMPERGAFQGLPFACKISIHLLKPNNTLVKLKCKHIILYVMIIGVSVSSKIGSTIIQFYD